MTIELFKAWVYGQKDYIARLVELSTAVENALNQIFGQLTGQSGSLAVPYGLQEIFDRRGLIGIAAYDFAEGQLSGPGYNFTVSPGTYWNAGQFYRKTTVFTLSMAGKATGTYYLSLDGAGNPLVSTSPDGTTTRQFSWDAASHRISAKALFAGVNLLFDGDDYHDMLDSAARSRSFTSVAARLEEIEQLLAEMGGYYAFDRQDGLNFYYKAGKVRNDSTIYETSSGHVTCASSQSNYIEVDPASGTVSVNQTGFTSGRIPLYLVVTGASGITTITDKRTWAIYGAGGGGGGGGHTQNTDLGTTGNTFTLNLDETAAPSQDCQMEVERGTAPNVAIRWNETTDRWEYTEDGTNWKEFGEVNLDLGVQELTKYVAKENPDLVLQELNRGSSVDYEDLDLSGFIDAPQGVQAVALRVIFWDEVPGNAVNIKFKKRGSISAPPQAFTIWSGLNDPGTIILPTDEELSVQFLVAAGGAETANLRVFLLGYLQKVTGVGTQDKTVTRSGITVGAGAAIQQNLPGFCNRGLVHYLKVEETGGLVTGTYTLEIHGKDSFDSLLYKAEGMTPTPPFEDWLPFWVQDYDGSGELHLKIRNHDLDQAGTYQITLKYEMFA
jgi:YD repeat-containing protein